MYPSADYLCTMSIGNILTLIQKEFSIEIRNKQTIVGVLLFSATVVFLLYKSFNQLLRLQWDVMLWIVLLFVGINAIVKSFSQENQTTKIYNYTLYNPTELIIAKMIYNFGLLLFIFTLIFIAFSFFFEYRIEDFKLFLCAAISGIFGISTIFSFISAISGASEDGNTLLMSILGLPLTLPILLLLVRCTANAMGLITDSAKYKDVWMILGIDMLFVGLVIILFDELWKS